MTTSPPAAVPADAPRPVAVLAFLAITLGLSWLAFLPVIVGGVSPESTAGTVLLPLVGIGSPTIAAIVVVARVSGRKGLRALGRGGTRWRVGIRWYAIVVLLPALAYLASLATMGGAHDLVPGLEVWIGATISGLLVGALEEFGWSGFAFPALQARYGFLWAGVAMGLIVAVWHLPLFVTPGQPQTRFGFPAFLLSLIPVRILFGWIYNGTHASILLCVFLHASGNAWTEILPVPAPHFTTAWAAETAVFTVAAALALLTHYGRRLDTPGGPKRA
jgi:membrane protease YdiL (CAAX protease family)